MINDENKAKWYVVHTYSGHENRVAETLRQKVEALDIEEKLKEILVPTREKIIASGGERKEVEERLFPGYILLHMVVDDETWPVVRNTDGVTGFVGASGKPTPLPEEEVAGVKKFMELDQPKIEVKFKKGDSVKITDGAFADFVGEVREIDEEKGRLKVLVTIFGRETPVDLDFLQVEPL